MNRRLLICCLIFFSMLPCAVADILMVAGRVQQLTSPFVLEKEEILAPVIPALRLIGNTVQQQGKSVTIITPDATTVKMAIGSTTASVAGKKMVLALPPRVLDEQCWLPIKCLAPILNVATRYDATTRTLQVMPLLTLHYEVQDDGLTVQVCSAASLQFNSNVGSAAPRITFDFKNSALVKIDQQFPIDQCLVNRLRMTQQSTSPPSVRLDIELVAKASVTSKVSEQGRLVTINIGKYTPPILLPIPSSPVEPTPPVIQPVTLLDAGLKSISSKQSELTIRTSALTQVSAALKVKAKQLCLTIANGVNSVDTEQLRQLHDNVIEKIEMMGKTTEAGTQVLITFKKDAGYLIEQNMTNIRILMGAFDIRDMVIVLDAGHGGNDVGAVGQNGTFEKDINLDVILRVAKLLKAAGAKAVLSRCDDTLIPLKERPVCANNLKADIFLSVHCNSMPNPNSAAGTETYYNTPQSARLAQAMQEELLHGLGLQNRGVRTAGFLVIRQAAMPSVLMELAFLNNTREEALLLSVGFRQRAAEAILNGVRRYAATNDWHVIRPVQLDDVAPVADQAPAVENDVGVKGTNDLAKPESLTRNYRLPIPQPLPSLRMSHKYKK